MLMAAALLGAAWPFLALCWMTVLVTLGDRMLPPSDAAARTKATWLPALLAVGHLSVLPVTIWAVAQDAHLGTGQSVALIVAAALYLGQVGNANAHELIHARPRWARRLGRGFFAWVLFGHHGSAHPLVHHVHVATPEDPNSAPLGMGFYRFWPRAWWGSYLKGWQAEQRRHRPALRHPYLLDAAISLLAMGLALASAGLAGLWLWLAVALYVQMQLLLTDYVQHYGLRRRSLPDGRIAPVDATHAWNAAPWLSGKTLLNAPRHSDHHMHPARPFPQLRLTGEMPMLPRSLPVMAALALVPPAWRRVMDPRVQAWQAGAERADLQGLPHADPPDDSCLPDRSAAAG